MLKIEDAAKSVGLSVKQTRRRLAALSPLMDSHIARGANNALLLDSSALELLRRLEDYRKTGLTVAQAVEAIRQESEGNRDGQQGGRDGETAWQSGGNKQHEALISWLEDENKLLREEIAFLHERIIFLENQAKVVFPVPKPHRRWWPFLKVVLIIAVLVLWVMFLVWYRQRPSPAWWLW